MATTTKTSVEQQAAAPKNPKPMTYASLKAKLASYDLLKQAAATKKD